MTPTAALAPAAPPSEPSLQLPQGWSVAPGGDGSTQNFGGMGGALRMTVKELIPVGAAKDVLNADRICVLAQLSLQSRIASKVSDRRILHLPEAAGEKNEQCYYVYADGALLRRVVVYRAFGRYYDAEMQQCERSLLLSQLADSQGVLIRSLQQYLEAKDSAASRRSTIDSHNGQQR
jgi:hypothetical protein